MGVHPSTKDKWLIQTYSFKFFLQRQPHLPQIQIIRGSFSVCWTRQACRIGQWFFGCAPVCFNLYFCWGKFIWGHLTNCRNFVCSCGYTCFSLKWGVGWNYDCKDVILYFSGAEAVHCYLMTALVSVDQRKLSKKIKWAQVWIFISCFSCRYFWNVTLVQFVSLFCYGCL